MKYAQVPVDTFESLVVSAGVLTVDFDLENWSVSRNDILGATNGGINFRDQIAFKDLAEGIDNLARNTMEFKKLDNTDRSITVSGTFKSANRDLLKRLIAAADVLDNKITPRGNLKLTDFSDIWMIVDYSDVNDGADAGGLAIEFKNALHTGGFQLQTQNADTGDFSFEFMAHFSIDDPDSVPYAVYVKNGGEPIPGIELNTHYAAIDAGDTLTLTATTEPADAEVTWTSSNSSVADVTDGVVSGEGAGNAIITASITQGGVTFNDTCTIVVNEV